MSAWAFGLNGASCGSKGDGVGGHGLGRDANQDAAQIESLPDGVSVPNRGGMTPAHSYPEHTRAVMRLGLPLIGGHLAQFAIGLTDTIMIGWYGVQELAALTLSTNFLFTVFLFGCGFAWAIMPMVAALAAKDDDIQIRRATRMAMWLSILYFLVVLPLFWFSGPILRAIGQDPVLSDLAQDYLRVAGLGMLPALAVMVLKNYLAGLEYTRVVLWITIIAALANVVANYALVFGNWGAPELGIVGAAMASVLVQVVSVVLVVVYARHVLPHHQLFVRFWRPDWEMFARVFMLGWPIGLTTLAEVTLFAGSAVLVGWFGAVPLAAHGVVLQLASATFMVQLGLANVATVRAGNAMGRGDAHHLHKGAVVVNVLGGIWVAVSILAFVVFPDTLMGWFLDPDEPARDAILQVGRGLMIMAALFQLMDAVQVIHLGLLRGLQDTRVPLIMAVISYWGIGMTTAFLVGIVFGFGAMGVWFGLVLGLAAAAVLLMTRFWRDGSRLLFAMT